MNYIIGIVISIGISIILGIFIPKIRNLYVEKSRPLEIKPTNKRISFSKNGNNWNEEFFVYLINNSDSPYYDINIVSSEFPKDIDLSMLPEKINTVSLGSKENGVYVGRDFMLVIEKTEETRVAQTVINNIGPNEKNKIKVIIENAYSDDFVH